MREVNKEKPLPNYLRDGAKSISKIYIYRILTIIVNLCSMLWVVPVIAGNQEQYAVYMVCMSVCLFLTYCDFGFLGASQKYAAEAIGKGDSDAELSYIGFSVALVGLLCLLFCIGMTMLSLNPTLIIRDLSQRQTGFASNMLLTVAIMMPVQVVLQRTLHLILSVRLLDYLAIRVDIIFNSLKIIIIPLFYDNEVFLLLEYFICSTLLSILSCIVGFFSAKKQINISLKDLSKAIRFERVTFDKLKYLAGSSSLATLFFILYYELDLLIAGTFFSIEAIAYYALAFSFFNFVRALFGVIYSPFLPLMNLKYGESGELGAKEVAYKLLEVTVPLFIFLAAFLAIYAEKIVIFWVGPDYSASAHLIYALSIGLAGNSFVSVAAIYFTTMQRHRDLVLASAIRMTAFFIFLFIFFEDFGVTSLAYAKTIGSVVASIFCVFVLLRSDIVDSTILWRSLFFLITGYLLATHLPSGFGFAEAGLSKDTSSLALVILVAGAMIVALTFFAICMFSTSRILLFLLYRQLRIGVGSSIK